MLGIKAKLRKVGSSRISPQTAEKMDSLNTRDPSNFEVYLSEICTKSKHKLNKKIK